MLILTTLLFASPALAADATEDAPEFLLGDVGVRIDLPKKKWKMTRWSDWDFKGETNDKAVLLFAWATPYQKPVTEGDLDAWSQVFLDKAAELGGKKAKISKKELVDVKGRPTGRFEVELRIAGGRGVLMGATTAVEGQMFHMATVGAAIRTARIRGELDKLVKRLDVKRGPAAVTWNASMEAKGIRTNLPEGWREPLKPEVAGATKRAAELGVADLDDCWLAMRPKANAEPDVMVTCQAGMLLGVVDEHSFEGKDAELRPKLFGKAEIPAAQRIDLPDRVGFLWNPHLEGRTLAMAAVPYDKGIAVTRVLGEADDTTLEPSLRAAVKNSSWSGAHPAGAGDWASYLFTYRLFSPLVLVPLLLVGGVVVVGGGGAAFMIMGGGRDKYADLADED